MRRLENKACERCNQIKTTYFYKRQILCAPCLVGMHRKKVKTILKGGQK